MVGGAELALGLTGLVLQVGGVALAGAALIAEWRSGSKMSGRKLKVSTRRKRDDPWSKPIKARYRRPSSIDRREYRESLTSNGGLRGSRGGGPTDPAMVNAFEFVTKWMKERDLAASADWRQRLAEDEDLRAQLVRLFDEQSATQAAEHNATQSRIRVEAVGLLIAVTGTVISSLPGLIWG